MDDSLAPEDRRVLIVGTGALATLFAWRLARAGCRVSMLGTWQAGLQALRSGGARLVDAQGREQTAPVEVIEQPEQARGAPRALVLVKSWQTRRAAEALARCLAPGGLALTLQNGLGNYETLAGALGPQRAALGSTTAGATLLGPGLVKPAGNGGVSIQSGVQTGGLPAMLEAAGFGVHLVPDAQALVWGKLVVNSAINPLTALLGVPNGELVRRPAARALMRALAGETAAVAAAEGAGLGFDDPAAFVEQVARETSANYSSMLQDVRRGAPTEIDAISGAIVRAARRRGLSAPLNEACWQLVTALVEASVEKTGAAA